MTGFGFGKESTAKKLKLKNNELNFKILNKAFKYHAEGNTKEAEKIYQLLLNKGFNDSRVLNNYGVICKQNNQIEKAIDLYKKSINLYPKEPEAYSNLGNILSKLGKLEEAESFTRIALKLKGNYVEALCTLGNILKEKGSLHEAEKITRKCIALNPNHAIAHSNLGNIYRETNRYDLALFHQKKAIQIAPDLAQAYCCMGGILMDMGQSKEAEKYTRDALQKDEYLAEAYSNLGCILVDIGQLREAEKQYYKAISIKPYLASTYYFLSRLKSSNQLNNWQEQLFSEKIITNNTEVNHIQIYFARANIMHSQKKYKESASYLQVANDLKLKYYPSNKEIFIEKILNIKKSYKKSKPDIEEVKNRNHTEFIFIVGMPRSGSTLLESIISMNENVEDLGEKNLLEESILEWGGLSNRNNNQHSLREIYKKKANCTHKVSTDKWLYNFQYAGVIASELLSAKIIYCNRNPLDNILSIYRANFTKGNSYSSSLEDATEIYMHHKELMKFYKNEFPNVIYNLNYDLLVKKPEQVIKPLIEWLRWEWRDDYLSPHLNKRNVSTASNVQVRSPINSKSLGGWKNYEEMLFPAIQIINNQN